MCGISLVNLQKSHKRPFFRSICESLSPADSRTRPAKRRKLYIPIWRIWARLTSTSSIWEETCQARSDLAHLQLWDKCFSWFAVLFFVHLAGLRFGCACVFVSTREGSIRSLGIFVHRGNLARLRFHPRKRSRDGD
jgi:hypothetical protein